MLPEMTVEIDNRLATSHGLRAPTVKGSPEHDRQLSDMVELVDGAKRRADQSTFTAWPERVLELLTQYAPFEVANIQTSLRQFGFRSWKSCVEFVMNDNCDDFASLALVWTQKNSIPHSESLGFIDGDGTGFKTEYMFELNNKDESLGERGSLEKAFDAKYNIKQERPLVVLGERNGDAAASCMVNYVHPGHWAYPAGHGAKFYAVVKLFRDRWDGSADQDLTLLTAGYVLAMARSGGGVHFPEDNIASGYIVGLPEFSEYGA